MDGYKLNFTNFSLISIGDSFNNFLLVGQLYSLCNCGISYCNSLFCSIRFFNITL